MSRSPVVPPGLSACECGTARYTSHRLSQLVCCIAPCPLHPGCLSPPPPTSWMNVSSLTPKLSDFHIVQLSHSSDCSCFYICCCPSFGCARKQSVSSYTSMLAGSHPIFQIVFPSCCTDSLFFCFLISKSLSWFSALSSPLLIACKLFFS